MSIDLIEAAGLMLAGSAVLAALVLAFDRLAPARLLRERHDLALAVFLVTPLLFATALQPEPAARQIPELITTPVQVETPVENAEPDVFAMPGVPGAGAAAPDAARLVDLRPVLPLLLALWLAGSAWTGVRLVRDLLALQGLMRRAEPVLQAERPALSRPVAIARSAEVSAPLLAGYRKPVILLPFGFPLNAAARPVLEHEIAHAERGDAWIALVQRVVTIAFWWVLPLHALQPVIARSREMLCDRRAALKTGAPDTLAGALLDAAARRAGAPSLALAAAPSRSDLARRVSHLANFDLTRTKDTAMRFALILPVLAAGTVLFTPHVGAARESAAPEEASHSPLRRLDDALDLDGSLFMAASRGRSDRVEDFLSAGADPNARFSGDGTPLIAAVRSGDARSVQALLEAGADPDLGVPGDGNPLIMAAASGNRSLVDMLLEAGADVDAAEPGDGNALIAASLRGHADLVSHFLEAGADPNAYVRHDETPLINAAQQGHIDVAELLVAAGADVSLTVLAPRRDGEDRYRSPLSEARRNGHGAMVRWLEARGAEHLPPAE